MEEELKIKLPNGISIQLRSQDVREEKYRICRAEKRTAHCPVFYGRSPSSQAIWSKSENSRGKGISNFGAKPLLEVTNTETAVSTAMPAA